MLTYEIMRLPVGGYSIKTNCCLDSGKVANIHIEAYVLQLLTVQCTCIEFQYISLNLLLKEAGTVFLRNLLLCFHYRDRRDVRIDGASVSDSGSKVLQKI